MDQLKKLITIGLSLLIISTQVFAGDSFAVKDIEIRGLQHIKEGTVLNYVPIQVGQTLHAGDSAAVIRALYKTGFFSQVNLQRSGNTLIIDVKERPSISHVTINGNKAIPTKALLQSLSSVGLAQGKMYDRSTVDNVKDSLQSQYYDRGNYAAKVDYKVIPDGHNQVAIHIHIDEGANAKIQQIKIIGNEAFKEKKLLRLFKLSTPKFWSFATKNDQYSKEKLDADIEKLRSFYLNQGYIQFQVESTQVSITPDRHDVYIVIRIHEGPQFHVSGSQVKGELVVPEKELESLIEIKPGEVFSREKVTDATMRIGNALGDHGFSFAMVRPMPEVDIEKQEVFITFLIQPGSKTYVRRINFFGNTKTADEVLRRELRQMEAAVVSRNNIKISEYRLNMLGFFKNVKVVTRKVPEADDQVDLEFHVIEEPSASVSLSAGYSDTNKFTLNGGYHQPNFMGTGNALGLNFSTDRYTRNYSASLYNPYHTPEGIGRGFNLYAHVTDYDKGMVSTYTSDRYGLSVYYDLPVAEKHHVSLGYGYQVTDLETGGKASVEVKDFTRQHGKHFYNVMLNGGWSYSSLDRPIYPTKGLNQSADFMVALPGGGGDEISYYKLGYAAKFYYPLYHDWIISMRGEVGYGGGLFNTDELPFFENYYAGGIGVPGAIRGYKGYSVGPRDSNNHNFGGNFMVDGTVALIIPSPVTPDVVRLSTFLDFGNVYTNTSMKYCAATKSRSLVNCPTEYIRKTPSGSGPVRVSAGVSVEWKTPMGPIALSLARPLNRQPGDIQDSFQFTVGTSIG